MHYCYFGTVKLLGISAITSFIFTSSDACTTLSTRPGSIQARGENLFSLIKAFTNSSKLQNAFERESLVAATNESDDERAVFFDYLSWFLVCYSPLNQAVVNRTLLINARELLLREHGVD